MILNTCSNIFACNNVELCCVLVAEQLRPCCCSSSLECNSTVVQLLVLVGFHSAPDIFVFYNMLFSLFGLEFICFSMPRTALPAAKVEAGMTGLDWSIC